MRERGRGWPRPPAPCPGAPCGFRGSSAPLAACGLRAGSGVPALGPRLSRVPPPPRPPSAFLPASHRRGPDFLHRPPPLRAEFPGTLRHFWLSLLHALRGPRGSPRLPCTFIPTSLAFLNFLCISFLSLLLFLMRHL